VTPLLVERPRGETQLFVKEVKVGSARDILCRNEAEAERDRSERQAILAGLSKQLARGDKALIGNSAYRRYLRRTASGNGKPGPAFEIDPDLDHLQEATIEKDGKRITTRTAVAGQVGNVFQAAGIALPPNRHERTA
jgi:hypothetical protein